MARTTLNLPFSKMAYISEASADEHYTLDSRTWYSISGRTLSTQNIPHREMLFGLEEFPASLKRNKLYGIQFVIYADVPEFEYCTIYANYQDFDADTVTYETRPTLSNVAAAGRFFVDDTKADIVVPKEIATAYDKSVAEDAYGALRWGSLRIVNNSGTGAFKMRTVLSGGSSPYAIVTYDSTVKVTSEIVYRAGPKTGYYNPREAAEFAWAYAKADSDAYCASPYWTQSDATFFWKSSAESTYHEISAGTSVKLTIPANTFPVNESISWYVTGTDDDGTTSSTPVYTFSTTAGEASASPVSPDGSIEDGSAPITLAWNLSSTDGQSPTRVEGQWRQQGEASWTPLFDLEPAAESFEAAAGTFTAGQIDWRVRAYNIDDTPGEWADASFVCQTAPSPVSGLAATNVPLTTVTWQSSGQEAYEISIDGNVVQKDFGAVTSWQTDEPLQDGEHEIRVRIQGAYGLWSQPASVYADISNTPETTIALSAMFGIDAVLSAEPGQLSGSPRFQWYRDNKRIGSTSAAVFKDRFVLGSHRYYVEIWHDSGNYSRSNEVSGEMSVRGTWIARFSGGAWLDITLTDRATDVKQYSHRRTVSSQHVTGARFPVLERSTFQDSTGSYSCAFRDQAAADALEAMKGETVIVKSRRGKTVIGCLANLTGRDYLYYTAYTFSLDQIEWEDFVAYEDD